ncbi:MAG: hypothetical protein R6U38_18415 [Desulfatiglandaceae bacterium]
MDIFSPVKKIKKRGKPKDEFDSLTARIDKFAPREHQGDREVYYYNYRMMAQYRGPLLALLETVAQTSRHKADPDAHARELFVKLKAFYDIKDRLCMAEAVEDINLKRRFRDLFRLFYGQKNIDGETLRDWLTKIETAP